MVGSQVLNIPLWSHWGEVVARFSEDSDWTIKCETQSTASKVADQVISVIIKFDTKTWKPRSQEIHFFLIGGTTNPWAYVVTKLTIALKLHSRIKSGECVLWQQFSLCAVKLLRRTENALCLTRSNNTIRLWAGSPGVGEKFSFFFSSCSRLW